MHERATTVVACRDLVHGAWKGIPVKNQNTLFVVVAVLVGLAALIFIIQSL